MAALLQCDVGVSYMLTVSNSYGRDDVKKWEHSFDETNVTRLGRCMRGWGEWPVCE